MKTQNIFIASLLLLLLSGCQAYPVKPEVKEDTKELPKISVEEVKDETDPKAVTINITINVGG